MTSVSHIQAIIERVQLDVLVAYATDGTKLDQIDGDVRELQAAVELMNESFEGPFYVEAYKSSNASARGRKADTEKPFRWKMAGVSKAPLSAAPPAQPITKEVRVPDTESIRTAEEQRANASIAEFKLAQAENDAAELRARVAELEMELEEVDEEDEPETGMMAAPQPWWESEEKMMKMMGTLRDLLQGPQKPAPAVPKEEGITEEERQLLQAYRKFEQQRPEDAKNTRETLLSNFGSDEQQQ